MHKLIGIGAVVILLALAFPGTAQDPLLWVDRFEGGKLEEGAPAGWELEEKEGKPQISLEKDASSAFVHFYAKNASFGIKKDLKFEIQDYPYLNWKWKVAKLPQNGNFLKKETDDQAAQFYVLFPRWPAKVNTDIVCYYWETEPKNKGVSGTSVAWSKAKIIVLQAGPEKLNQWVSEKRNVYEDYKKLFGKEPPKVGGVAFYINSQHTRSEAESYLSDIYFSKK